MCSAFAPTGELFRSARVARPPRKMLRLGAPLLLRRAPRAPTGVRHMWKGSSRSLGRSGVRHMWKGSSRSLGRSLLLENGKFFLFLVTPLITAALAWNDDIILRLVQWSRYITYPPEAKRPPRNTDELKAEIARITAAKKAGE